jgi:Invasion associated locus B (IalB) protein
MAWTMAGRRRKDAGGLVLFVEYLYSGVGDKGGGIRLHIAEFPKLVLAARGFFFNVCRRHGGGPMTGTRAVASAFILATSLASVAFAQQPPKPAAPAQQPAKPAAPAAAAPAKPAAAQPAKPATTAAAPTGTAQPALLGQYGDWGAYAASPGGGKVCFALAKPKTTKIEPAGRKRDPSYVFVSTRPAENVKNEVSVIIGYPFKTSSDATAEVGAAKFAMYTQNDGAWIKNVAEEARMVDAMRKGADLTVKGTSGRGTASTDQYSLKGLAQALEKIEQECK